MKIKKSVNILGHEYKVKIVDSKYLPDNTVGLCRFPDRIILLSKDLKGEMLQLVFWHECRHAYHFENGDTQILHPQVQEKDCEQFASFVSSLKKQGLL